MQAMRRAFEQFKDCDLDVRVVTYAGAIDPELLAVEQEYLAYAAKAGERKRARAEESKGVVKIVAKKAKTDNQVKLSLPVGASAKSNSVAGESTPACRKKEDDGAPAS